MKKKDPVNGLKRVDQADTYSARLSAMSAYNQEARNKKCFHLLTEQDHMPPKSTIQNANNNALSRALFGSGPNDMLAMTYLKPDHRVCGTTGCSKGIQAIHNLITNAINTGNVVLTYKYSILATNTDEITSPRRDFTGYMQEYFDRLGKLVSANQKKISEPGLLLSYIIFAFCVCVWFSLSAISPSKICRPSVTFSVRLSVFFLM